MPKAQSARNLIFTFWHCKIILTKMERGKIGKMKIRETENFFQLMGDRLTLYLRVHGGLRMKSIIPFKN